MILFLNIEEVLGNFYSSYDVNTVIIEIQLTVNCLKPKRVQNEF
jgi:hypothetical protein